MYVCMYVEMAPLESLVTGCLTIKCVGLKTHPALAMITDAVPLHRWMTNSDVELSFRLSPVPPGAGQPW